MAMLEILPVETAQSVGLSVETAVTVLSAVLRVCLFMSRGGSSYPFILIFCSVCVFSCCKGNIFTELILSAIFTFCLSPV